jgi:hypothetical protein
LRQMERQGEALCGPLERRAPGLAKSTPTTAFVLSLRMAW